MYMVVCFIEFYWWVLSTGGPSCVPNDETGEGLGRRAGSVVETRVGQGNDVLFFSRVYYC